MSTDDDKRALDIVAEARRDGWYEDHPGWAELDRLLARRGNRAADARPAAVPDDDLIERVARLLDPWAFAYRRAERCGIARNKARLAIEQMRVPTRAMVDAGVAYALNVTIEGAGGWSRYVEEKHRRMIDAALNPSPAKPDGDA